LHALDELDDEGIEEVRLTRFAAGLGEANGRWNLVLQGLQEDDRWRSLDRVHDRCRDRPKHDEASEGAR
jgi:hypothetical protein